MNDYTIDGLIANPINTCNFTCGHCAFESAPDKKGEIPIETMKRYIEEIPELGINYFTITGGGEPFLYNDLDETIIHANRVREVTKKPKLIVVSTNGSWVTDKNETFERLSELKNSGLDTLAISDTYFHRQYNDRKQIDRLKSFIGNENVPEIVGYDDKDVVEQSLDYAPIGRARNNPLIRQDYYDATPFCDLDVIGRYELNNNGSCINVFPEGIYACCFKMFKVGEPGDSLGEAYQRSLNDPLLRLFGGFGVKDSIDFMKESGLDIDMDTGVADCTLCEDISRDAERQDILRKHAPDALKYMIEGDIMAINHADIEGKNAVVEFWDGLKASLKI